MPVAVTEHLWTAPGGGDRRYHYRTWRPEQSRGLLVILHGFGEHGGRYAPVAERLAAGGWTIVVPDLWAHGSSGGLRGDLADLDAVIHELRTLVEDVCLPASGHRAYAIYAHSFGGLLAIRWAVEDPGALARLVIQSPLIETAFHIPTWKISAAEMLAKLLPRFSFSMNIDVRALCRDAEVVRRYQADPAVHNRMSARTYVSTVRTRDAILRDAARLQVPVLLLLGSDDQVISTQAAEAWLAHVACDKRTRVFPGAYHELHFEPMKDDVLEAVARWLRGGPDA